MSEVMPRAGARASAASGAVRRMPTDARAPRSGDRAASVATAGSAHRLGLIVWTVVASALSLLFVAGLGERYRLLASGCGNCESRGLGVLDAGQVAGLAAAGVDIRLYAWWDVGRESALAIGCLVLGTLLVTRVGTVVAFLAATVMVAFGSMLVPEMAIAGSWSGALPETAVDLLWAVAFGTVAVTWFVLPDGKVPRWSWPPLVAATTVWASVALFGRSGGPPPQLTAAALGLLVFGIATQVHRYRRASTDVVRQQLTWLAVGLAGWTAHLVVVLGVDGGLVDAAAPGSGYPLRYLALGVLATITAAVFPFAWSMAILKHRLWDVDRVLSRGVLAATVTAGLVATYLMTVLVVAAVAGEHSGIAAPLVAAIAVGVALMGRRRVANRITRLFYGTRDAPYDLLAGLWADANRHNPDVDTVVRLTRRLVESLQLSGGRITITGDTGVLLDRTVGDPVGPSTGIPLAANGVQVGVLAVWPRLGEHALPAREARIVVDASAPIAHLAGTVRLTEDLRRSRAALVAAAEEERRRIYRDLHDDLGPTLAGQALILDAASSTICDDPERASRFVTMAKQRTDEMMVNVRRLARDLRPEPLDHLGLGPSLRRAASAADSARVHVEADIGDLPGFTAAAETAAYRIISEALANAIRHSAASSIRIEVRADGSDLTASVVDNGRGGAPTGPSGGAQGLGLRSMHARARQIGGTVDVTSVPGHGTAVTLVLPAAVLDRAAVADRGAADG